MNIFECIFNGNWWLFHMDLIDNNNSFKKSHLGAQLIMLFFNDGTSLDHSNPKLVLHSDPHCTSIFFIQILNFQIFYIVNELWSLWQWNRYPLNDLILRGALKVWNIQKKTFSILILLIFLPSPPPSFHTSPEFKNWLRCILMFQDGHLSL